MKIIKWILIVIAVLIMAAVLIYAYYGGFKTIKLEVGDAGGETLVYENVIGDYSQTAKISDRVYQSLLHEENIETIKAFGIYYDNPKKVEKDKLRSEVGCIVEGLDSTALQKLSAKYQVKTLPVKHYIITTFPFKGSLSILVGIIKIYPLLNKYFEEQGIAAGPVMEIYDIPNKKIIYRQEILQ